MTTRRRPWSRRELMDALDLAEAGRPLAEIAALLGRRRRAVQQWLRRQPALVARVRRELRGKALACWCAPKSPCHAEILVRIANNE